MPKAYIALGSNLQDPAQQITQAFLAIDALDECKLLKQSSLYKTKPVGYDNQPDFINAAATVETSLSPQALLDAILKIEADFGRERPFPNAPRILDLDLLHYENEVIDSKKLTIPHPRMHQRAFVMLPLAEIAPDLTLPKHGNVVKLAQSLNNDDIVKHENHH